MEECRLGSRGINNLGNNYPDSTGEFGNPRGDSPDGIVAPLRGDANDRSISPNPRSRKCIEVTVEQLPYVSLRQWRTIVFLPRRVFETSHVFGHLWSDCSTSCGKRFKFCGRV